MIRIHPCVPVAFAFIACPARAANVVFWNTLGSQTEIENSVTGADGTFGGGTFTPGPSVAHGNAWVSPAQGDAARSPLVTFPRDATPRAAGTLEFWARLTGVPDQVQPGGGSNPAFVGLNPSTPVADNLEIRFNSNDGLGGGGLCGLRSTTASAPNRVAACTGAFGDYAYEDVLGSSGKETWHHYALVWDENGIAGVDDGTRRIAVYVDGVLDSGRWFEDPGASFAEFAAGELGLVYSSQLTTGSVAIDNLALHDIPFPVTPEAVARAFAEGKPLPEPGPPTLFGLAVLLGAARRKH